MATANRSVVTKKAASPKPQEATALLRADHKKVSALFAEFETTRSAKKKKTIVSQICRELTAHTIVEEEIFYPAVQAALKDHELVPEANVEHGSVKDLSEAVRVMAKTQLNKDLKDDEVGHIVAFLNSLTGSRPTLTSPYLPQTPGEAMKF